jgi:hypothetical protein
LSSRRQHIDPALEQRAVKQAVAAVGLTNAASCHSFRHSQWLCHAGLRPGRVTDLMERVNGI